MAELVLVALAEERVDHLHRRRAGLARAAIAHEAVRILEVAAHHEFAVGDHDAQDAARLQHPRHFAGDAQPVVLAEVLEHVFAEDAVEAGVGERQRALQVDEEVHARVPIAVDIHPVAVVDPPRTGAEVQQYGRLSAGDEAGGAAALPPGPGAQAHADEVKIPPQRRERAVAEQGKQQLTQRLACQCIRGRAGGRASKRIGSAGAGRASARGRRGSSARGTRAPRPPPTQERQHDGREPDPFGEPGSDSPPLAARTRSGGSGAAQRSRRRHTESHAQAARSWSPPETSDSPVRSSWIAPFPGSIEAPDSARAAVRRTQSPAPQAPQVGDLAGQVRPEVVLNPAQGEVPPVAAHPGGGGASKSGSHCRSRSRGTACRERRSDEACRR